MCRTRLSYEGEILSDKRYIYLLECHIAEEDPDEDEEDTPNIVEAITRTMFNLSSSIDPLLFLRIFLYHTFSYVLF